ncbi:hypothetical protein Tco_1310515 [Tanacetum coccineum]
MESLIYNFHYEWSLFRQNEPLTSNSEPFFSSRPPEDINAAVIVVKTARTAQKSVTVQQMKKGSRYGNQEKKLSCLMKGRQMRMVGGNGGNQFRQYAGHNVGNQNGYNAVQNFGKTGCQDAVSESWCSEYCKTGMKLRKSMQKCILMANLQHSIVHRGVDNTAKTRRPQPRSNTKNDRVPSAS